MGDCSKTTSFAFLSSLQPKNVVWRSWSSAVNSVYSTSQTSLGRTHCIFSLMLGGLTNGHFSVNKGFIFSTAAFLMTRLRTAAHEETKLLTVLYFPFRQTAPIRRHRGQREVSFEPGNADSLLWGFLAFGTTFLATVEPTAPLSPAASPSWRSSYGTPRCRAATMLSFRFARQPNDKERRDNRRGQ